MFTEKVSVRQILGLEDSTGFERICGAHINKLDAGGARDYLLDLSISREILNIILLKVESGPSVRCHLGQFSFGLGIPAAEHAIQDSDVLDAERGEQNSSSAREQALSVIVADNRGVLIDTNQLQSRGHLFDGGHLVDGGLD